MRDLTVILFVNNKGGDMDARRIEIFLRIAELGSINKAATELRISQPSLSRLLAHLEEEVGAPLLVRTRQGVSLTDAGEILVERAQPLLRQLQMIREEIGTRASSHFNLAMPFSLQRFVTAPLAEAILREAPQTTLRVYEGINNSIRIWMERGLVDAAVMVSTERAPDTFAATPLLHEGLMLVGDRKAGLRLDAPAPLSRLGAAQLILPGRPNVISAQVENALRRSGLPYQNRFEAESLSLCLELTRRGLGYTVMPYSALHHQLEIGGDLSAAPIRNLSVTWQLHVNRARRNAMPTRSVIAMLAKQVKSAISEGGWRFAEVFVK